ncbi:MAG: lamin tail domain-containing protein, partial [Bacteroidota bacterium]
MLLLIEDWNEDILNLVRRGMGFSKYFIIGALSLIAFNSAAQLTDDFTDGTLSDPDWSGNNDHFIIEDEVLRLNAPAATGSSFLTTTSEAIEAATWSFNVKMNFNPSGSNFARIYLISSNPNLTEGLQGYFVRIGGSDDEVSLFRQDGSQQTKIIDGTDDRVDQSSVDITIRVVRDRIGNWVLSVKNQGESAFTEEGEVFDDTYVQSSYFGMVCTYTSTRANRFFFDDITVQGESFQDRQAPEIVSLEAISSNQLVVRFSELGTEESVLNVDHYHVDGAIGNPVSVELYDAEEYAYRLFFNGIFENGRSYRISVSGVSDEAGNVLMSNEKDFVYLELALPTLQDVIINEIFPDPSPIVGLPDEEYIELFNRSSHFFNLEGWRFTDGSSIAVIDSFILKPQEYVVLTSSSSQGKFSEFMPMIYLANWPTLNNASDQLSLMDGDGRIIDAVAYTEDWYRDEDKQEGGWALERIDSENVCGREENWRAAKDNAGGTPAAINSVFASNPDLRSPSIISAIAVDSTKVKIDFNELLDSASVRFAEYSIDNGIEVVNSYLSIPDLDVVLLDVSPALTRNSSYTITIERLTDCSGNLINDENNTALFALPEEGDSLDIVINEILFDPRPGGVDFVELYNRSQKFINLNNWSLGNSSDINDANAKLLSSNDQIISPNSYVVITSDLNILKDQYPGPKIDNGIELSTLPSFPNEEGTVVIFNAMNEVVDEVDYHEDFHFSIINNVEGISLERVDSNGASDNPDNWKSASSRVGYATPGYQNSQISPESLVEDQVTVVPKLFTPDNDGMEDFVKINYQFDNGGYVANVEIFDFYGRTVKRIDENDLISSSGFYI